MNLFDKEAIKRAKERGIALWICKIGQLVCRSFGVGLPCPTCKAEM
jgi:hypothetical protein